VLLADAAEIGARRVFVDSFGPILPSGDGIRDPRDAIHVLAEGLHPLSAVSVFALTDMTR
jgi:hypothetical protein